MSHFSSSAGLRQASDLAATTHDDIDLHQMLPMLKRRWRLIAATSAGSIALSGLATLLQRPVWEGQFQIVLATSDNRGGGLAQLAATNPMLANLAGLSGGGSKGNLETEITVLESPSVLKPVFDFVRDSKRRSGQSTDGLRFDKWRRNNVEVTLEKGTTVLNISYKDTDRELILPVIESISRRYQEYSGRDRRRVLANGIAYLKQSIGSLTPVAEGSMRRAQAYALSHGFGLGDGMPSTPADASAGTGANSVEAKRQQAQAKVLLLRQQLAQARTAGNAILFQAPQLEANTNLYQRYQQTEARLSELRSRLRDNDQLVSSLQRERVSLIATLNRQTIGLLEGELATAQANLVSSSRPKEVVLKHRELVRQALRDEKTLANLEEQLQLTQLEQAKQGEPWELISTPALLDRPVSPRKGRNLALGLLAGLVVGSGAGLVLDRRSGLVFNSKELRLLLPYPMLGQLDPKDPDSWTNTLRLLAQGPLAGLQHIAVIPVGQVPADTEFVSQLGPLLLAANPKSRLLLTSDLSTTMQCDCQLLLATPGAATRTDLALLRQNLLLQGRSITGLLLLCDGA